MEALEALTAHVIARHYPEAKGAGDLLDAVIAAQVDLVARWMGLGFIHGVMNTDNTQIAGETIDYGPCAFMDAFHPSTVFSSIDQFGRYAYNKQPEIIAWNLAQLASCLLPRMGDQTEALARAQAAIDSVPEAFQTAWLGVFRRKLGFTTAEPGDGDLIEGLLRQMAEQGADFTNTFRGLATGKARDAFPDRGAFEDWAQAWRARLDRDAPDAEARLVLANPALIPRNHRIEAAIQAALRDDLGAAERLIAALSRPYDDPTDKTRAYTRPPEEKEIVRATFCGT